MGWRDTCRETDFGEPGKDMVVVGARKGAAAKQEGEDARWGNQEG